MSDWGDFLSGRREYALLAELLSLVAGRIGDEDAAKKFILDWYWWEDPFPWVFDSLEVDAIIQDLHAAERYFWRKLEFVTINWKSSSAVYNGPRIVCRRDGSKEWPIFEGGWQVTIRANLVQFRVDVALKRLRLLELAPSAAAPEPVSTPTPGSSPASAVKANSPLKQRVPTKLSKQPPKPGESMADWARRALPEENVHSVLNVLSMDKSLWENAGGTPAKRGRKPPA
jgi:hypothetical protein